jgi:exodeoxyribonuclease-3
MKLIAWNVNGINARAEKGLIDFIHEKDADFYLFQEIRTKKKNANSNLLDLDGYHDYWFSSEKKMGYSGVTTYCNKEPLSLQKGMGIEQFDREGRLMTLEFERFYLINVYFPNAGTELERLEFKTWFNKEFLNFCEKLRKDKPLLIGGDFNVAHTEKDLAEPEKNQQNAGFTIEETEWFSRFLRKGYIDTFREFEQEGGKYTYWSYQFNSREKNLGWRIDYFIVSDELEDKIHDSYRLADLKGSDHCPICLKMENLL